MSLAADTVAFQQQLEFARLAGGVDDQVVEDLAKARAQMERSWLSSLPTRPKGSVKP